MKHAKEKRFFAHHERLRNAVTQLQDDLINHKFKPQEMPAAVLRLEKLYMKLLREDWHTLQTGSKVAYVPSEQYPRMSEGNLTMRPAALVVYNQFFNKATVDENRNRDLHKYVPEMKDFENYQHYKSSTRQYLTSVISVLASALFNSSRFRVGIFNRLTREWKINYPEHMQKIRNIFKDIDYDIEQLKRQTDDYIYGKFKQLTGLVFDEKQLHNHPLYANIADMIRAIKFAEPVTAANVLDPTSLRA